MREFANSAIRFNKHMHDEDKLVYGIHPKDTTPTSHGTPTSQPGTEAENTRNHYEHLIRAINTERGDHSKPADCPKACGFWAWEFAAMPQTPANYLVEFCAAKLPSSSRFAA